MNDKTVYILGAGFSMDAKAPSQERLVHKIFEIHKDTPYVFTVGKIDQFINFLTNTLEIPEDLHCEIPLEDIFTPLDRCLMDGISFRDLTLEKIQDIRNLVYYLIGKTLKHLLSGPEKDYIDVFAKHLVDKCSQRKNGNYKNVDPISIISTNWDILLDTSLQSMIDFHFMDEGVIDYCCHVSSFYKNEKRVMPGLEKLGMGGFNVKLLKLHGSLNWLQCPRCLRVYIDLDNKIAIDQYLHPIKCRHCQSNFTEAGSPDLVSNAIMPTFLKNFSNPQYKLIWQNAGIELAEANRLVFIGYSLPAADFEMRQLLSRMTRSNAEIHVVDFGDKESEKGASTISRYKTFFGKRKVTFDWGGAREYIFSMTKNDTESNNFYV